MDEDSSPSKPDWNRDLSQSGSSEFWKQTWEREREYLFLELNDSCVCSQEDSDDDTKDESVVVINDAGQPIHPTGADDSNTENLSVEQSRKRSRDCRSPPRGEQPFDSDNDDEIKVLSSTTINPNIDYVHKRSDCGVYPHMLIPSDNVIDVDAKDHPNQRFCPNCYCVLCDIPSKDCTSWEYHCHCVSRPPIESTDRNDEILLESPTTTARDSHFVRLFQGMIANGRDWRSIRATIEGDHAMEELFTPALFDFTARVTSGVERGSRDTFHASSVPNFRLDRIVEFVAPHSLERILEDQSLLASVLSLESKDTGSTNDVCSICNTPLFQNDFNKSTDPVLDNLSSPESPRTDSVTRATLTTPRLQNVKKNHFGHRFHRRCIYSFIIGKATDSCLRVTCPFPGCDEDICKPMGKSPSGSLTIQRTADIHCPGYETNSGSKGVIRLEYHVPRSIQLPYQPDPGQMHSGVRKTCYLPDTEAGNKLLARLSWMFSQGMTFSIGLGNIAPNRMRRTLWGPVDWSRMQTDNKSMDFPHKTSMKRFHASNDPLYFNQCHELLDDYKIPSFEELDRMNSIG